MSTLYIVQSQVWPCWPNKTSFGQICERIILDDHRSLSIRWCTWSCSPEPKVYRARWRYGHTFSLSWRFSFRTLVRERKATCSKWRAEKTSEKLFPLVTCWIWLTCWILEPDGDPIVQYEWNARTQITMWFDNTEDEASLLRDYGKP